jgi:hypothetical protein
MAMFCLATLAVFAVRANGHGAISRATLGAQTACAGTMNVSPACTPTQDSEGKDIKFRKLIARSGGTPVPGTAQAYNCDWCGLEVRPGKSALPGGKWWTGMPAGHWDVPDQWPSKVCNSDDSFGDNGLMEVKQSDVINAEMYVNADHSGLNQFQLACVEEPTNQQLFDNPITPWRVLHLSKELEGKAPLTSLDIGTTKAQTDDYLINKQTCTGAGCTLRMNRGAVNPDNQHCVDNHDDCYVPYTVTIPADACPDGGHAVLRWFWASAEGPEVYSNCLDLNVAKLEVSADPSVSSVAGLGAGQLSLILALAVGLFA